MTDKLLIVDGDTALTDELANYFRQQRWEVLTCASAEQALKLIDSSAPNVVLTEQRLSGQTGTELAARLRGRDLPLRVLVMSPDRTARTAVEALKAGAFDYIPKPIVLPELQKILGLARTIDEPATQRPAKAAKEFSGKGLDAMVGTSPAMQDLKSSIQQLISASKRMADGEFPAVLIRGETGTGKELVARALHFDGPGRDGPLIELNCATIPAHLLEAELFGHQKGAFTDAKASRIGLVEAADGGTLFLDEIGEIDLSIQAKLLKLLEDKTIRPLGSVTEKKINVRIISATHRNLEQMVRDGAFRSDLYFRLRIVSLKVPALRARGPDAVLLARHFLDLFGQRYGKRGLYFSANAEHALAQHAWPGNVRELRNLIEQTVVLAPEQMITAERLHLRAEISAPGPVENDIDRRIDDRQAVRNLMSGGRRSGEVGEEQVRQALSMTNWNVTKSARLLGLSRDMLRYRIEQLHLERPQSVDNLAFVA